MRAFFSTLQNRWFTLTVYTPAPTELTTTMARERQRKARMLSTGIFAMLLIMMLIAGESVLFFPDFILANVLFIALLITALWLNRRGRFELAVATFLVSYLINVTWSEWATSPGHSAAFLWEWIILALPALFAGFFLPFWAPLLFGVFDMALILWVYFARQQSSSIIQRLPSDDRVDFIVYDIIITLSFAAIGAIFAHSIASAVALADRAAELEVAHSELAQTHTRLENTHHDLSEAYRQLTELASHDPITGLLNHRALNEQMAVEIERATRLGQPLGVIFTDIDHFKLVNDTWGHALGDQALQHVARCLRNQVRVADLVARYGGEEFVILLPNQDRASLAHHAERLRAAIAASPLPLAATSIALTASLGVALYPADGASATVILNQADQAMYRAKQQGRNRVCLAWDTTMTAAA